MRFGRLASALILSLGLFPREGLAAYGFDDRDPEVRASVKKLMVDNKARTEWLLGRETVGIEVITAASSRKAVESLFGHTLIRLIDRDDNPMNDGVIAFNMLITNPDPSHVYQQGFDGKSTAILVVQSMADALVEYSLADQRMLTRVIVPVSADGISKLKSMAKDLVEVPSLAGNYSFFSSNCATLALNLLAEAGVHLDSLGLADVPLLLPRRLADGGYTIYPSINVPTAQSYLKAHPALAPLAQDPAKAQAFWAAIAELPANDIELLFQLWPVEWSATKADLAKLFRQKVKKARSLGEVLGLRALPLALYRACAKDDSDCRDQRTRAAVSVWPRSTLLASAERQQKLVRAERARALQMIDWRREDLLRTIDNDLVQDELRWSEALSSAP